MRSPPQAGSKEGRWGPWRLGSRARSGESWLTPGGAWGSHVHRGATCEPAAAQQRGAHHRDWAPRPMTEAATQPGGWQRLGRGHSPESPGRRAHGGGPGAVCAPAHRFSSPSPALHLSAPRPWLRLALAAAPAGRAAFGRRLSAASPARRLRCGPAPPAPPSRLCAGSVAAARSAPARWAPRLPGAEATPAAVSSEISPQWEPGSGFAGEQGQRGEITQVGSHRIPKA